jgi:hypothetical protein
MTTSTTTRENMPAIVGGCARSATSSSHKRRAPVLVALTGSAALAKTAAGVKRQRCSCAIAPPWWISP